MVLGYLLLVLIIITFKSTFLFSPAPHVIATHQLARAPRGNTDGSRGIHLGFIHSTKQALKATTESFKNVPGHDLHSSERRMTVVYATNKTLWL